MSDRPKDTIGAALDHVAEVLGGDIVHVNRGESEDYFRGYNTGYDAGFRGGNRSPQDGAPEDDPWRSAYTSGYHEGYRDGTGEAIEGYGDE